MDEGTACLCPTRSPPSRRVLRECDRVQLFRQLDPGHCDRVDINPNGPAEDSFFLAAEVFGIVELWAGAIATKRLLPKVLTVKAPDVAQLVAKKLRAFAGYQVIRSETAGAPFVTLKKQRGLANAAVVFTAPDATEVFLAKLPSLRTGFQRLTMGGPEFFAQLTAPTGDLDGAIFNPLGPAPPCALPLAALRVVGQATR